MLLDLESKALVTILWNGSKCFRAVGVWESWTSLHLFNTSFYFEWQCEQCKYETSFYQLLELLQDLLSLFYWFFLFWILANRPWKVFCRVRLKKPKTPQTKKQKDFTIPSSLYCPCENSNSGPEFSNSFDCSASEVCTGELFFQSISSQHFLKLMTL